MRMRKKEFFAGGLITLVFCFSLVFGFLGCDLSNPVLSIDDVTVGEADGTATFTITASKSRPAAVMTVQYATADGEATAGVDYTSSSGTATIYAGTLSQTVTVTIVDDTSAPVVEPTETFYVNLSSPSANAVIGDGEGLGVIIDDDGRPTVSVDDVEVGEDAGSALFTISATYSWTDAMEVQWETQLDGTSATPGDDYVTSSGTATITTGNTEATFSVTVLDDSAKECDETYLVALLQATNAFIAPVEAGGEGLGTILDNDESTLYEDAEDGDTLGWSVFDNNPAGATIGNVIDSDRGSRVIELSGSGTGNGYLFEDGNPWGNATQHIIEWSMKSTSEVRVFVDVETTAGNRKLYYSTVDYDNLGTGTFIHFGLGTAVMDGKWHAFLRDLEADLQQAQPSVGILTVNAVKIRGNVRMDDIKLWHSDTVFVTIDDVNVAEDGGPAVFTISASTTEGLDVIYLTQAGTAEADHDYVISGGVATIPAGTPSVNVTVSIIDDTEEEEEENFFMNLYADSILPCNAVLWDGQAIIGEGPILPGAQGEAAIEDDDSIGKVYEDAEDGLVLGWTIFDSVPGGATVSNVIDTDRGSRVIELSGTGTSNGYWLRDESGDPWHDTNYFVIEWSMKCTEEVRVFVDVETTAGNRKLYYSTVDYDTLGTGTFVHYGLGTDVMDGQWHTFVRDLEADLQNAQPSASIIEVNGIKIRGSARFDDINLWQIGTAFLTVEDLTLNEDVGVAQFTVTASESSSSDMTVSYQTSNGTAVAPDDYTSSSGTATISSGNTEVDINVTIIDDTDKESEETFILTLSDADGEAVVLLDDTAVATIKDNDTPYIVYEDAEDGDTLGWSIFDNDPAGATVSNVIDTDRGSRVIELSGSGTANGYELQDESGDPWNNTDMFVIEWSMKSSGEVRVFVDMETSAGNRKLYYATVDYDNLGTGTFVHYGIGSGLVDGQWHTIVRDLQADLENAQPGVTITAVNGMRIRGSARFDDIKLLVELPPLLSINDVTVAEGAGSAVFTITASETSESEMTVDYETSDGSAEAGYDYITSSGTATIATGSAYVNVSVSIIDDSDVEGDEAFSVILSNPTNSVTGDDTGEATLPANDLPLGHTVYEDAEDGDTSGWSVYDNTPAGGTVSNVYDTDRGSRIIELSGSGTSNGYLFEDGNPWNNTTQSNFYWAMKCSEDVRVFVAVETTAGQRFLQYTPVDTDNLGTGTYVHHGLGSDILDGEWHTFVRDLDADLKDGQPTNSVTEVDEIRIRGNGSLDDIILY